jgi:hypothetical protein
VRKREGMRQLETLRHRWEGNIKTDLNKDKGWNHLAVLRDKGLAVANRDVGFFFYLKKKQMHKIVISFTVIFFKYQIPTLFGPYWPIVREYINYCCIK